MRKRVEILIKLRQNHAENFTKSLIVKNANALNVYKKYDIFLLDIVKTIIILQLFSHFIHLVSAIKRQ